MAETQNQHGKSTTINEAFTFFLASLMFLFLSARLPELKYVALFFFIFFSLSSIFLLAAVMSASRWSRLFQAAQWWDNHVLQAWLPSISMAAAIATLVEIINIFGGSSNWSLISAFYVVIWFLLFILAMSSTMRWRGRVIWAQYLQVIALSCGLLVVISNLFNAILTVPAISDIQSILALGIGLISLAVASFLNK